MINVLHMAAYYIYIYAGSNHAVNSEIDLKYDACRNSMFEVVILLVIFVNYTQRTTKNAHICSSHL